MAKLWSMPASWLLTVRAMLASGGTARQFVFQEMFFAVMATAGPWAGQLMLWIALICCSVQAEYSDGVTTLTMKVIFECQSPQNSAHWAGNVPILLAVKVNVFVRPGITSRLNRKAGTKKEWITSREWSSILTGSATGISISAGLTSVLPETKNPSFR